MMTKEERIELLYNVANLYYVEKKKKYEIAAKVGQSPTQVANLLREAAKKEIVTIQVSLPRLTRLQNKLKNVFRLRDAIVIPSDLDCSVVLKRLGQASAEYFHAKVKDRAKVALGGGYLMYEMVNRLKEGQRDIEIFPAAIIARGPDIAHIDPLMIVTFLWARSGRLKDKAHCATVTPLDKCENLTQVRKHYDEMLRNKVVKKVYDSVKSVDWVFASIGGIEADAAYTALTNYATRNLLDEYKLEDNELRNQGVVGDIVYSFFDENGDTRKDWDIVPSIGVDQLKKMAKDPKKQVVVVVGSYKMRALRAVLKGKLCNILITDARAAELLIK